MSDKITRVVGTATILDDDGDVVLIRRWNGNSRIDGTDMLSLFEEWRGQDVEVTVAAKGTDRSMNDRLKRKLAELIKEWEARAGIAETTSVRSFWLIAARELRGRIDGC